MKKQELHVSRRSNRLKSVLALGSRALGLWAVGFRAGLTSNAIASLESPKPWRPEPNNEPMREGLGLRV